MYKTTRKVISLSVPPFFIFLNEETARKLVVLYSSLYYHSKPCNHGNHSAVKQLNSVKTTFAAAPKQISDKGH